MSALILASGSATRAKLLHDAGVTFSVQPAAIDEERAKTDLETQQTDLESMASGLAKLKALQVSASAPGAPVLGCDQILVFGGRLIAKSRDMGEARALLRELRGKAHLLVSAAVLAQDGRVVWRHQDSAKMVMRPFGDRFLDDYLKLEGPAVLGCVGCYRLEGPGVQLFERIEGDYFTVLGLTLLPLLEALREMKVLTP